METFWTKYVQSNTIERMEQLEPIVTKIEEGFGSMNKAYDESDVDSIALKSMKAQILMSYFDDLIEIANKTDIECYDEGYEMGYEDGKTRGKNEK